MSGQISVEVDAAPQVNLAEIMAEIREEYEGIAKKNNKQLEEWYKQKVRVDQNPLVHPCIFNTGFFLYLGWWGSAGPSPSCHRA